MPPPVQPVAMPVTGADLPRSSLLNGRVCSQISAMINETSEAEDDEKIMELYCGQGLTCTGPSRREDYLRRSCSISSCRALPLTQTLRLQALSFLSTQSELVRASPSPGPRVYLSRRSYSLVQEVSNPRVGHRSKGRITKPEIQVIFAATLPQAFPEELI